MPFTAAHPLAVVPVLRRLGLDPTCLVIGSMAPDFEYFVRGEQVSTISHTLAGLWLWNLPATLILAALLHGLVKWPMLLVAPVAVAGRAAALVARPWRARASLGAIVSCVGSALIGSATHVIWDGVTHAQGFGPRHYHALKTPITLPVLGRIALHRALQDGSTLLGVTVLGVLIVRGLVRRTPIALPPVPRAAARGVVATCVVTAAALTLARLAGKHATDPGDLIVGAIAGLLAGVIVASAVLTPRARRLQRAVIAAAGVNATASV
ncbi:MAG: DUF4184 family protein [Kofleriaceae bacterium]